MPPRCVTSSRVTRADLPQRARSRLNLEVSNLQWRTRLATLPARAIPESSFNVLRTGLLRRAGWNIGATSTVFGVPTIYGQGPMLGRLTIGDWCIINFGSTFELNDLITIGNCVQLGHQVLLMTTTHEVGDPEWRAGKLEAAPISIGDGAWVGARAVVLPGVTIGAGSIVGAGSVVNRDVPPNVLAGGVPARVIKSYPEPAERSMAGDRHD